MLQIIFLFFAFHSESIANAASDLKSEVLRFNVPADGWRYSREHQLKGKYYRISMLSDNVQPEKKLRVFKDRQLKTLYFEITSDISLNGDLICGLSSYVRPSTEINKILDCKHGSCTHLEKDIDKQNFEHSRLSDSEFLLKKRQYEIPCKYKLDFAVKPFFANNKNEDSIYSILRNLTNAVIGLNYYVKIEKLDLKAGIAEIRVNDQLAFLELSYCQRHPQSCEMFDIKTSDYEKDLEVLKSHQSKKDLVAFNTLIEKLSSCLIKKDVACVKSFFPNEDEEEYLSERFEGYVVPNLKFDNELFKELESCLSYKNLLPHLMASKGVKKVCIFNAKVSGDEKLQILNVTYPEAVRVGMGYSIYVHE